MYVLSFKKHQVFKSKVQLSNLPVFQFCGGCDFRSVLFTFFLTLVFPQCKALKSSLASRFLYWEPSGQLKDGRLPERVYLKLSSIILSHSWLPICWPLLLSFKAALETQSGSLGCGSLAHLRPTVYTIFCSHLQLRDLARSCTAFPRTLELPYELDYSASDQSPRHVLYSLLYF